MHRPRSKEEGGETGRAGKQGARLGLQHPNVLTRHGKSMGSSRQPRPGAPRSSEESPVQRKAHTGGDDFWPRRVAGTPVWSPSQLAEPGRKGVGEG